MLRIKLNSGKSMVSYRNRTNRTGNTGNGNQMTGKKIWDKLIVKKSQRRPRKRFGCVLSAGIGTVRRPPKWHSGTADARWRVRSDGGWHFLAGRKLKAYCSCAMTSSSTAGTILTPTLLTTTPGWLTSPYGSCPTGSWMARSCGISRMATGRCGGYPN